MNNNILLKDNNHREIKYFIFDIFFESLPQIIKHNKLNLFFGCNIALYEKEDAYSYYRRGSTNKEYGFNNDISLFLDNKKLEEHNYHIYYNFNKVLTLESTNRYIDNILNYIDKIRINNVHNYNHNTYINYNNIKEVCDKHNIEIECYDDIIKDKLTYYQDNDLPQKVIDILEKYNRNNENDHYALVIAAVYLAALIYDNSLFEYKFIMNGFNKELIKDVDYYINIFINKLKHEIETYDNSWRKEYSQKFDNLLKIYLTHKSFYNSTLFECEHLYTFFYNYYKEGALFKQDGFFNVLMHKLKQYIKLYGK